MATRDGKCVVVANYTPAGNYVGQYKDNVLPVGAKPGAKHDPKGKLKAKIKIKKIKIVV